MRENTLRSISLLLIANAGLLVWASGFAALYAGLSIGCAVGLDSRRWLGMNVLSLILGAIALAHLTPLIWLAWRQRRRRRETAARTRIERFYARLTLIVSVAGIIGLLWIAFPLTLLPPCESHGAP